MHDAFMENSYSETLKAQNIEKPNDIKSLGAQTPKGLNRIAKNNDII